TRDCRRPRPLVRADLPRRFLRQEHVSFSPVYRPHRNGQRRALHYLRRKTGGLVRARLGLEEADREQLPSIDVARVIAVESRQMLDLADEVVLDLAAQLRDIGRGWR